MSASQPALANLVRGGDAQTEAVEITPYIFMARDISNAYLVTTDDGDVMVNTGFMDAANQQRNFGLLNPHRKGALKHIILTQSHADHFGGVPKFKEAGTTVIGGPGFNQAWADMQRLQGFFGPRSFKLWGSTMQRGSAPPPPPQVVPDLLVDRHMTLEVGNRTFELIHAPEGETVDNLIVWMPREKVAFTGNLVGPVWLSMPFLCTLRGDKPRAVWNYLASMEKLKALNAEMIITGHGEPILGAERIRADITKMIDAVTYVRDYTLDGMIAGKNVHELMAAFAFPDALKIGEFHGKASWAVRTIWEEYSGWLHYEDGTTALYGVPRRSVDADLAELAGGADVIATRARVKLDAGEPLPALHLVDIALGADAGCLAAWAVRRDASQMLLAQSGGSNLSETMWLRSEIAACEVKLAG
ncbi:MAG: hypothetical protein RLY97_65 [Pseudomonadota bacterium]|jgi:alkyl sulfatase BDS1-like metallo-beta-lactamase superfamily hydrolase